jgi:hypothetical protein
LYLDALDKKNNNKKAGQESRREKNLKRLSFAPVAAKRGITVI